jgi:hypothetical protein
LKKKFILYRLLLNDWRRNYRNYKGWFLNPNIQQALQAGLTTNIQQTITDSAYTLSMTIQSQTTTYSFIKISNTKIEYVSPTNGLPNLPLTKQ